MWPLTVCGWSYLQCRCGDGPCGPFLSATLRKSEGFLHKSEVNLKQVHKYFHTFPLKKAENSSPLGVDFLQNAYLKEGGHQDTETPPVMLWNHPLQGKGATMPCRHSATLWSSHRVSNWGLQPKAWKEASSDVDPPTTAMPSDGTGTANLCHFKFVIVNYSVLG